MKKILLIVFVCVAFVACGDSPREATLQYVHKDLFATYDSLTNVIEAKVKEINKERFWRKSLADFVRLNEELKATYEYRDSIGRMMYELDSSTILTIKSNPVLKSNQ